MRMESARMRAGRSMRQRPWTRRHWITPLVVSTWSPEALARSTGSSEAGRRVRPVVGSIRVSNQATATRASSRMKSRKVVCRASIVGQLRFRSETV